MQVFCEEGKLLDVNKIVLLWEYIFQMGRLNICGLGITNELLTGCNA